MAAARGYLTMAVGRPRFLEMAVDMALSLREHTALPIALATDAALADVTRTRYPDVFDEVTLLPQRFLDGRGRKYGTAEASPFEETVYVDADCFVLDDLDPLFDALSYSDLAMVGSQLDESFDENHHGFSSRWLMKRFDLPRYMKTNSGIYAFRRSKAMEIMEECLDCFVNEARPSLRWHILLGRWLGDEIAFGIVGGRRNLRTLPQPSPMYWPQEFDAIDLDAPSKPLLHLIWPPPTGVVDEMLARATARRAAAGVPGDAETHWRDEVEELKRMVRRRRFAERIGLQ